MDMLILFLAKNEMKGIDATVCARTNEYGANHGSISSCLQLRSGKRACCYERQQMMQGDAHAGPLGLERFDFIEGDFWSFIYYQ